METNPGLDAEGLALVHVLATVLDRLCVANAPMARADPGLVTKFHAMKAPGIAILQYLERIHKYASCSNECFVLALIYIDRLIQRNNFLLTELNAHRVVITAVLLAAKFFDDAYYNNAYYAKVGGVLVTEMNGLEVDFLFRINFSLHVTPEVFEKYRFELLSQAAACVALSMQQLITPINSTSAVSSHLQHQPNVSMPNTPVVCNPQAPITHNYTVAHQTHLENSFLMAVSSQITPPQGPTLVTYNCSGLAAEAINFHVPLSDGFDPVQRSHSCPADQVYQVAASCGMDRPYFSAPAIITPALYYPPCSATSAHVAALMNQKIFPIQNVLVHHDHGGHQFAIQPKADPRAQLLTGGLL